MKRPEETFYRRMLNTNYNKNNRQKIHDFYFIRKQKKNNTIRVLAISRRYTPFDKLLKTILLAYCLVICCEIHDFLSLKYLRFQAE